MSSSSPPVSSFVPQKRLAPELQELLLDDPFGEKLEKRVRLTIGHQIESRKRIDSIITSIYIARGGSRPSRAHSHGCSFPQTLPASEITDSITKTTTTPSERRFTSKEVHQYQFDKKVSQVEYSQDGNFLAVAHDIYVDIFKMNTDTNNIKDIFQPFCRYQLETSVKSLSFSPDSNYLAVVSNRGNALTIFYDLNHSTMIKHDSRCQRILIGSKQSEVPKVTFSYGSKYIAVTTNLETASVYIRNKEPMHPNKSAPSFELLRDDIHQKSSIASMQFSPDSESLAIGTFDEKIHIYNYTTGKLLHEIQEDSYAVISIKYSNNGQFLAAGTYYGTLSVYNVTTYKHIKGFKSKNKDGINDLAFSNSDNFIAMGFQKTVLIYDFSSDTIIYEIPVPYNVFSLTYSANDEYLIIACDNNVLTFDTSIYKNGYSQLRDLKSGEYPAYYSPNGTYLVTEKLQVLKTVNTYESGAIQLMDSPWCYKIKNSYWLTWASFSMDEQYLAFADRNEGIFIWDLVNEKEDNKIDLLHLNDKDMRVTRIQYSSNGKYLAVTTRTRNRVNLILKKWDKKKKDRYVVLVYDAKNNYQLLDSQYKDDYPILSVVFSFDEKLLAVVNTQRASIYDLESQGRLFETPFKETIPDIKFKEAVFSNDLRFLAVPERDSKKLIIYDLMKGSTFFRISPDPILAFSPDSKVLAIGTKNGLVVDFLQLIHNGDKSKLEEWKPYASPIYFPDMIKKISFAPMTGTENDEDTIYQKQCYTIYFTQLQDPIRDKYCITTIKLHQHTVTPPELLLESDDTRICDLLKANKYSPLTRNQEEKTMISLAANEERLSLVEKLIKHNPSLAFATTNNLKGDNNETNSNGIMKFLMSRYHLNSLSNVAGGQFFDSGTSLIEVNEMYDVIMKLVQEQVNSSIIVKLLNAGEKDCMDGFVIYGSMYVTAIEEPMKWWFWPSLLFKSLRREIQPLLARPGRRGEEEQQQQQAQQQIRRPLAELQKPRSSKTEWILRAWQDLIIDDEKRVELKVLRVLLPKLACFESLKKFTNMSDNKPFGCQSLHAAIDANWSNWARRLFLGQLILYVVWLIAFTVFCEVTRQLNIGVSTSIDDGEYGWLVYCLAGIVVLGVLYFFYVEIRQIKVISKEDYFNDWWNYWQWIVMISVIAIVTLRLIPGTSESLNGCISAMSLFCSWLGLLYHLRGFESCAWISIALYRISKSLCAFILIFVVVIFSFSLALHALHNSHVSSTDINSPSVLPVESGSIFLSSLKTTFFASIAGEIDDDDFFEETYFHGLLAYGILILLLVVVYIISQNALIAFISERFDRVLDEKNAVLKKQKAKVILDLYCLFSNDKRRQIEEENKWTSLVIPAADLSLEEEPSTLEKNVSRATKEDMKDMKKDMREINIETKKEMQDMKKEMKDMKKETREINVETKKEIKEDMRKQMHDMKEEMKELKEMMQQIIDSISNTSKQGGN